MQQTVLITGGASGIGLAIAEAVLAEGWHAIVADIAQPNLDAARETLSGSGDRVRYERLDVTEEAEIVRLVARCDREFGPLTGVVNSAGISGLTPVLETGTDLFRRMLEVNLIGSFTVAREAARLMKNRRAGSIVNIASVVGILGSAGRVAYSSSKGGVITMTKVMAVELAEFGLRVNAIAPGPIQTPLSASVHTEKSRAAWMPHIPQGRFGTPQELTGAAIFLLDDRKSSFVTGQIISVDGGFTAAGVTGGI